jgi:putative ABC transport system permease protein
MASIIGAVAAILVVASNEDQNRRNYQPALPTHAAWTEMDVADQNDPHAVAAAMRATLPTVGVLTVRGPSDNCPITHPHCVTGDITLGKKTRRGFEQFAGPTRWHGGDLPMTVVNDGSGLQTLFGKPEPDAAAALRDGDVVVVDRSAVAKDGTVVLRGSRASDTSPSSPRVTDRTVSAFVVSDVEPVVQLIVPPSVATRLGVTTRLIGVFARDGRAPTDREQQALRGKLNAIEPQLHSYVETGYHDDRAWAKYALVGIAALIAIGAALIATALANVDGRADLVTLGAVGASPRTRRVLSSSRAGVIAGIGAALGTAAGFIPALAWVRGQQPGAVYTNASYSGPGAVNDQASAQLHLVVPWLPLAAVLIGIPLLAALLAGLFSRSRLPSERVAVE